MDNLEIYNRKHKLVLELREQGEEEAEDSLLEELDDLWHTLDESDRAQAQAFTYTLLYGPSSTL